MGYSGTTHNDTSGEGDGAGRAHTDHCPRFMRSVDVSPAPFSVSPTLMILVRVIRYLVFLFKPQPHVNTGESQPLFILSSKFLVLMVSKKRLQM